MRKPKFAFQLSPQLWELYNTFLKGATIHQTMGPRWRTIYLSPINRPYVCYDEKVEAILQKEATTLKW